MFAHLDREEKAAIAARIVYFLVVIYLGFFSSFNKRELSSTWITVTFIWMLTATVLLLFISSNYKILLTAVHVADTLLVTFFTWSTGGAESALAFILPLLIIPGGLFVSGPYAAGATTLLGLMVMYTALEIRPSNPYQLLFWLSYFLSSLVFTEIFLARRFGARLAILHSESEKMNRQYEWRIAKLEKDLTEQKILDDATGLKNFRHFRVRVEEEISRAARYKTKFSLAVICVEKLDIFEKDCGAVERDRILMRISNILKQSVRDTDQAGRYTRDQFMILLVGSDPKQSIIPARRIGEKIAAIKAGPKNKYTFPVSIGIAGYPDDAKDITGLLSMAVSALDQSRLRGAGKITLASALYRKFP